MLIACWPAPCALLYAAVDLIAHFLHFTHVPTDGGGLFILLYKNALVYIGAQSRDDSRATVIESITRRRIRVRCVFVLFTNCERAINGDKLKSLQYNILILPKKCVIFLYIFY